MSNSPKPPEYYAKKAPYLGWGEEGQKLDKQRLQLLEKYIVGKKILDIGCGLGFYTDYLSKQGHDSWGVDFVTDFINQAKKSRQGNFVLGKAEQLPFEDNSFDTVILFDILEHGDDKVFLSEAKRVSRKRVLLIVPRQVDSVLEKSGVIFRHYLDKSHLREYQEEDLYSLSKQVNLKLKYLEPVHSLYNETIFLVLFKGPLLLKKFIRKIVFLFLPKEDYSTEYFAVLEK